MFQESEETGITLDYDLTGDLLQISFQGDDPQHFEVDFISVDVMTLTMIGGNGDGEAIELTRFE